MSITLGNASVYIAIISFAAALLKLVVITPLQQSIARLEQSIEKLSAQLEKIDDAVSEQAERIVAVERDLRNAQKRLDLLEGRAMSNIAGNSYD